MSSICNNSNRLFMAPHLVRAQRAYKDIRIHSFHYTHTHKHLVTDTTNTCIWIYKIYRNTQKAMKNRQRETSETVGRGKYARRLLATRRTLTHHLSHHSSHCWSHAALGQSLLTAWGCARCLQIETRQRTCVHLQGSVTSTHIAHLAKADKFLVLHVLVWSMSKIQPMLWWYLTPNFCSSTAFHNPTITINYSGSAMSPAQTAFFPHTQNALNASLWMTQSSPFHICTTRHGPTG